MTETPSLIPGSDAARALFPITEHTTFLNHAAAAPLSTRVSGAMHEWVETWASKGGRDDGFPPLNEFRVRLAQLINAAPEEVAIIPNTSEGLLLVAMGFPWREGDALLTAEGEFTANIYPWMPLQERGVQIIRLPARDHRILLEDVEAALRDNPNIRLLALSFVGFAAGFRNDLAALSRLCREHDVRFCVDAIQGAGAIDIDVEAMGIDFLSAGGPKWLMGPIGAGIFYVRRGLIPTLQSGHHGWLSTAEMDFFRHDLPWSETATRFEAGTLPWPSLHGLVASAETLLEVGIPNIERHVLALGDALIEGLEAKDYTVATPQGRGERGGIISFSDPKRTPADIVKLLDEQHITVSARGPFVRVSPHFYNNDADIERLLAAL